MHCRIIYDDGPLEGESNDMHLSAQDVLAGLDGVRAAVGGPIVHPEMGVLVQPVAIYLCQVMHCLQEATEFHMVHQGYTYAPWAKPREEEGMGFKKFGTGSITETENAAEIAKTAADSGWSGQDEQELQKEGED